MVLLVLGIVGTVLELLLLDHTEDWWQLAPVILLGASLIVLIWHAVERGPASTKTLQATMLLFVLSGLAGLYLHYHGNAAFELEMYPSLRGVALFWEAMKGATPALAPGTMIELGLIGLAYSYRHPSLGHRRASVHDPASGANS